jgi:hypothetical protein
MKRLNCRPVSGVRRPCVKNSYLRSYLRKSARNQWVFSSRPHNTNTQDEPLPPYSQRLRPPSPWKHPPWTRIVSPRLPISLLHVTRKAAFARQGRRRGLSSLPANADARCKTCHRQTLTPATTARGYTMPPRIVVPRSPCPRMQTTSLRDDVSRPPWSSVVIAPHLRHPPTAFQRHQHQPMLIIEYDLRQLCHLSFRHYPPISINIPPKRLLVRTAPNQPLTCFCSLLWSQLLMLWMK